MSNSTTKAIVPNTPNEPSMTDLGGALLAEAGHHVAKHTPAESTVADGLCAAFEGSLISLGHKLQQFPRHTRRQDIARFLVKYELFKESLQVNGSVVECGVFVGGGLSAWLHFSSILEPYNHTRRIIGFDTFEGFPSVHERDLLPDASEHTHVGAFKAADNMKQEIESFMALHDRNRPLGHIPKVELVAGDATKTIPEYVQKNPHAIISLMYLDFDIYEPTRVALEHLYPRVVKGGIVAFDELNTREFPGETSALAETIGIGNVRLRRSTMDPYISYFVKE
ncbi:MAG TPA: TylF/MycF/NovP-related O-methyltransferase [Bryobacteraceae bacterium]|nr:TylF/MycF/NovP-related O-methyltransferase [Bryobacteraceae bacterium]